MTLKTISYLVQHRYAEIKGNRIVLTKHGLETLRRLRERARRHI